MRIQLILLSILVLLFTGCAKENKTFKLKSVKLLEFERTHLPPQNLKITIHASGNTAALTTSENYNSQLSLPATLNVSPTPFLPLYHRAYVLELTGDVSGPLGKCLIDMNQYKIIFPIDIEVKNDSLAISMQGSWE